MLISFDMVKVDRSVMIIDLIVSENYIHNLDPFALDVIVNYAGLALATFAHHLKDGFSYLDKKRYYSSHTLQDLYYSAIEIEEAEIAIAELVEANHATLSFHSKEWFKSFIRDLKMLRSVFSEREEELVSFLKYRTDRRIEARTSLSFKARSRFQEKLEASAKARQNEA